MRAYPLSQDKLLHWSITWSKTCAINIDTKLFHVLKPRERERRKEKEERKENNKWRLVVPVSAAGKQASTRRQENKKGARDSFDVFIVAYRRKGTDEKT